MLGLRDLAVIAQASAFDDAAFAAGLASHAVRIADDAINAPLRPLERGLHCVFLHAMAEKWHRATVEVLLDDPRLNLHAAWSHGGDEALGRLTLAHQAVGMGSTKLATALVNARGELSGGGLWRAARHPRR